MPIKDRIDIRSFEMQSSVAEKYFQHYGIKNKIDINNKDNLLDIVQINNFIDIKKGPFKKGESLCNIKFFKLYKIVREKKFFN